MTEQKLPGNRRYWTITMDSSRLARYAAKEAAYQRSREAFYATESEVRETEIRSSGVTLREQQATGGPRFIAEVDAAAGQELATARRKREEHAALAEDYEAWAAFLDTSSIKSLSLDIDDVRYFRIGLPERAVE